MDQDEQHIVEDQPLKVLDLFPKREVQTLSLNYQNYSKLYQNLTCTICRQLFKSPVYLRCSHRFCKECIEKYIRSSSKRSCPNCRGQLSTKRDLRSDYSLQSLITFAFADVKSFTASMEQFDKIEIQRSKSLQLRRIDSLNESKQRTKQQTPEQSGNATLGLKRVKTNDIDQPKRRKKIQSQKKIQTKTIIQKQDKEVSPASKTTKNINQQQITRQVQNSLKNIIYMKPKPTVQINNIQNFTKEKGRKKKIQVIEIESNSEQIQQEVQEIRRQQFLNPAQTLQDKHLCSINMIPEVLPQVQSRIFSFQQVPIQAKNSMQEQNDQLQNKQMLQQNLSPPQTLKKSSEAKKQVNPQILRAIQLLKVQFGANFPLKLIQLTSFPFYTELTLKKHPLSILTPELINGSYKFSLRTALTSISIFISDLLNINKEAIKLHTIDTIQGKDTLTEVNQSLKLYQANQRYWKSWSGIQLLQLVELINSDSMCQQSAEVRKVQRIVYYSIDFSKLTQ